MNQTNETQSQETRSRAAGEQGVRQRSKVRQIAFVGLMGAVSAVLMLLRFPIPFLPPFLSFDLSGLMEIMGGFMFGPAAAFGIIVVKILLQLVMQGSFSFGTGEVQNLILSCTYVLPALLVYQRSKTKRMAAAGMTVSTVVVSVVAVFTNLYMIIPFYVKLFGMSMEDIISMCNAVNPAMKNAATMAVWGILPFNLLKYGVTSVLAFLLYKRLSRMVKGFVYR